MTTELAVASEAMPSVLITQCLQNDFVAPLSPHEPLPNALHVGRDEPLAADVAALRSRGTRRFYTFVTDDELEWAGVPDLAEALVREGIEVVRLPIPDQRVPTAAEGRAWVARITRELEAGDDIVLACMGGLGRSGMIAACVLRARGLSPEEAITRVRAARGPRAVETELQESFVRSMAKV